MPVTATNLTANGSTSTASSYNTASITPSSNNLVFAFVKNDGGSQETASLSGNSLTWVQVATVTIGATARVSLFRALGASPTGGAVTISFGANQTSCDWVIDQFANVDTTGTNGSGAVVQSATNSDTSTTTSLTVTLAAFGSINNATYGGFRSGSAISAGSGFTIVGSDGVSEYESSEFRNDNATSVNATWASDPSFHAGIAAEIKFAPPVIAAQNYNTAYFM